MLILLYAVCSWVVYFYVVFFLFAKKRDLVADELIEKKYYESDFTTLPIISPL